MRLQTRRTLSTWIPLLLVAVTLLPMGVSAQGSNYRAASTVRINPADTLQRNLMAAGQFVEIMGTINNDLYSASRHLILDGTVTDDAIVAGQVLSIRGHVGDMLMAAGESLVIDGEVDGDLFAAGRDVRITENAVIHGNAFVGGATIVFNGTVDGWLRGAGEQMQLNGRVRNKTELYGNDITFGDTYHAAYGTNISSDREIYRENLGTIPDNLTIVVTEPDVLPLILFKLGFFLSLLITGLVLLRLFQQTAVDIQRFATERFWKNTGVGLLSFLLVPLVIVVLVMLVFTIPLSFILAMLYGLALLVSYLLVAMILGVMSILYFKDDPEPSAYYWGLALGMLFIAILVNLPFIGWLFNLLLLFFGLGSLVYYIWMMSGDRSVGSADMETE